MIEIVIIGRDNSAAAADSAAANMKKVGDQAEAQGGRLKGFFDGVKNVALGLGGAAVVGLGAAAGAGLSFNNSIEQVTAKLNAFTKDGEIMAVSHKNRPIYGVQFHPESIATEYGHEMLENFLKIAAKYKNGTN